jgi:nicotinamidase/pyrazinamidase
MTYDPASALLVVDMQNDFVDPSGSLAVPGGESIVPVVNDEIVRASGAGAAVIYSQDWHPPTTPHFAQDGGVWPVHCVMGTWGSEFHPGLKVLEAPIVRKGSGGEDGYSVFSVRDPRTGDTQSTELDALLAERNTTTVVVVGLATDYCVKESALDALRRGYGTIVLRHAVRSVDLEAGDGERALRAVEHAGGSVQ